MKQALSLLADIANGIFAVLLAGYFSGTEIVWWHFIICIPLAMSPDLDALPELIRRGRVGSSAGHTHDHRDGLHFPILFLVTGLLLTYLFPFFGLLFLFATVLHFINDLYGTGWGIQLLWPLSKTRYKVLSRRVNWAKKQLVETGVWDELDPDEKRLRLIVAWKEEELPEYIQKWGVDDWIDLVYCHLNWISFIEYSLFILAMILLFINLV